MKGQVRSKYLPGYFFVVAHQTLPVFVAAEHTVGLVFAAKIIK